MSQEIRRLETAGQHGPPARLYRVAVWTQPKIQGFPLYGPWVYNQAGPFAGAPSEPRSEVVMSAQGYPHYQDELADLQREALKVIAISTGPASYIWLYVTVWWQHFHRDVPWPGAAGSYAGAGLVLLAAILGYALKGRRLALAAHLFVWGTLAGITIATLSVGVPGAAYLFILPVIFASVLLNRLPFLLVASVSTALALGSSLTRLQTAPAAVGPFANSAIFPVLVIAFVTIACWLSSRSLYTALAWVWTEYEHALHNEQAARDRQGELNRALKALGEATYRLERVNYMLALARDQAEDARRLKQQFAQTISHELRTPLNLIVGYAELMAEMPEHYGAPLPPAYTRDLSVVYRNASHLQDLVNDILDLARIEAAQMSILPEQTDPVQLVQQALDTVRHLVEARGLRLEAHIEDELPVLWLDPVRIRQVLFNLISNAVRFTERGGITVSAGREGQEVVFAVADTGVGIAEEDLARIFEEFQQAAAGAGHRHEGAGLGLAISRRFVELHGGRMWAESQVGQGSTFFFALPVERPPVLSLPQGGAVQGVVSSIGTAGPSEEPVLLAVTPSPAGAALLARHVHHCRTLVVTSLEEARSTARNLLPQLIVVDRKCEGCDDLYGPKLEALTQAWGLPHTPILTCVLPGEEPLRQKLAVDGYLVKPVSRQSVWDVLRRLGVDVDTVLVVDDDRDFVRLISRMLEDSPLRRYQVTHAYSGQQALARMRQQPPDLVLLDLMLPDLGGYEVAQRIRANPSWEHIPIVIISAQEEIDRREQTLAPITVAKADGLYPTELIRWVQSAVDMAVKPSQENPTPPTGPVS